MPPLIDKMHMSIIQISCSKKLKLETKEVHSDAEKLIIRKITMINSVDDYVKFIKLYFGFFNPLEILTRKYIGKDVLEDILERGNTKKIIDDIETCAGDSTILSAPSLPALTNVLQSIGAMYVMEGSTLGGQIIAKMLRDKSVNIPSNGLSFFEGYKENTITMWRSFTVCLDETFKTDEEINQITLSAKNTFAKMKDWIVSNDKKPLYL
jgi:heme oxygenase